MRAGKLRHKVTLYTPPSTTPDALGDTASGAYTAGATFYAGIEPLSGRELWFAQQVRADVTHTITMRYRTDLTPACQLRWNDGNTTRIFEVGPVLSKDTRLFMMTCTAVEKRL